MFGRIDKWSHVFAPWIFYMWNFLTINSFYINIGLLRVPISLLVSCDNLYLLRIYLFHLFILISLSSLLIYGYYKYFRLPFPSLYWWDFLLFLLLVFVLYLCSWSISWIFSKNQLWVLFIFFLLFFSFPYGWFFPLLPFFCILTRHSFFSNFVFFKVHV